ncbi:hypothetical protein ACQPW1_17790 [Nocardia sp. CA-128927]|uniref:hypothetical protein n=1 Tax=Nocardia sp. CA-128927 TaxID=3239975 RepID=UPI003D99DA3E
MARSAVGSTYGRTLFENQGVLATWLPDRPLRVGDVVSRAPRTGILNVETTLKAMLNGTKLATVTRTGPNAVTLQRGATIEYTANAGVPGLTAELTFTSESSFVFAAKDGSSEEYRQLAETRAALLMLASTGVWRDTWQLVTAVRRFTTCTIVIARQRGTTARISLDGIAIPGGFDTIAAASGVSITSGDAATWELRDAGPLYEALSVTRNFWSGQPDVSNGGFMDYDSDDSPPDSQITVFRAEPTDFDLP